MGLEPVLSSAAQCRSGWQRPRADGPDLAGVPPERRRAQAAVVERRLGRPAGTGGVAQRAGPRCARGRRGAGNVGTPRRRGVGSGGPLGVARTVGRRTGVVRAGRRGDGRRARRSVEPLATVGEPAGGVASAPRAAHRSGCARGARRGRPSAGAGSGAGGGAAAVAGSSAMRLSPLRAGTGPGSGTGVGISPVRSPASQPARCVLAQAEARAGRAPPDVGVGVGPDRRDGGRGRRAGARRPRLAAGWTALTSATPSSTRSRTTRDTPSSVSPRSFGQFAHGAAGGPPPHGLPTVGVDGDLVGRQVAGASVT